MFCIKFINFKLERRQWLGFVSTGSLPRLWRTFMLNAQVLIGFWSSCSNACELDITRDLDKAQLMARTWLSQLFYNHFKSIILCSNVYHHHHHLQHGGSDKEVNRYIASIDSFHSCKSLLMILILLTMMAQFKGYLIESEGDWATSPRLGRFIPLLLYICGECFQTRKN